jgi:hypothetical protein
VDPNIPGGAIFSNFTVSQRLECARAGFLVTPAALLYATGGFAYGDFIGAFDSSSTRTG